MPKKIVLAAEIDRSFHDRAAADARFEIADRPVQSESDLAAIAGDCEVLVTRSSNRVTRAVIDRAPRLPVRFILLGGPASLEILHQIGGADHLASQ